MKSNSSTLTFRNIKFDCREIIAITKIIWRDLVFEEENVIANQKELFIYKNNQCIESWKKYGFCENTFDTLIVFSYNEKLLELTFSFDELGKESREIVQLLVIGILNK